MKLFKTTVAFNSMLSGWLLVASSLAFSDNNKSNWMKEMAGRIAKTPLAYLALPGTHNSFSNKIDAEADFCDEENPFYNLFRHFVAKFSITQKYGAKAQLERGIRYFDLRVCAHSKKKELYTFHGLYSSPLKEVLAEIKKFHKDHPKEVIILHFHSMRKMNAGNVRDLGSFKYLDRSMNSVFGQSMLKANDTSKKKMQITIQELWDMEKTIIPIFEKKNMKVFDYIIDHKAIENGSSYANTTSTGKLKKILKGSLDKRPLKGDQKLFVSQGVLTPDKDYIIGNLFSDLSDLAHNANKVVFPWIATLNEDRSNKLNIVIVDYFSRDYDGLDFVEEIIKVNRDKCDRLNF